MASLNELVEKYQEKLADEDVAWEDLTDVLDLMVQFANVNEEFQDEFEEEKCVWQFNISDKLEAEWKWVGVDNGKFACGDGIAEKSDLIFICKSDLAAQMVGGAVDSNTAYMKGDLKIEGPISLGMKFQTVLAIFKDELEDYEA